MSGEPSRHARDFMAGHPSHLWVCHHAGEGISESAQCSRCSRHFAIHEANQLTVVPPCDARRSEADLSLPLDRPVQLETLVHLSVEMRRLGILECYGVRLDPHWSPPPAPALDPVLDPNPQANALAVAALRAKDALERELKQRASDDSVTFAHVNGVPDE